VHGQHDDPAALMRGTQNGRTIARLLQRAGAAAVTGPKGIFGQLQSKGFKVYPDNAFPVGGTNENGGRNGGPDLDSDRLAVQEPVCRSSRSVGACSWVTVGEDGSLSRPMLIWRVTERRGECGIDEPSRIATIFSGLRHFAAVPQ
jgi:hypothetical protein